LHQSAVTLPETTTPAGFCASLWLISCLKRLFLSVINVDLSKSAKATLNASGEERHTIWNKN